MRNLAILAAAVALSGCVKVPAGNVGVKVNLLGSDKGVDHEVMGVGRYWPGINEDWFLFPTFTQNKVFTASSDEGSRNDESITFQSKEGMSVSADVGVAYSIRKDSVSVVFQKYRAGVKEITNIHLRNIIRNSFVQVASKSKIQSLYGEGKSEFLEEVVASVRGQVKGIGIDVENVYLVGNLRLPPTVNAAIDAKIRATQMTIQRQNEIEQVKAEAKKEIEKAEGERIKRKKLADAKAYEVSSLAIAEAEAIRIKGVTLKKYPSVIKLSQIEKWDGSLPKVTSDVVPMMNIND